MRNLIGVVLVVLIAAGIYLYMTGRISTPVLPGDITADIDQALLEAPLDVSEFGGGTVTLVDGEAEFGVDESSPRGFVALGEPRALIVKGDDADVYALVNVNGGGSGVFSFLVRYEYVGLSGALTEIEKVMLGDRISVDAINTEPVAPEQYAVTVSLKDRKPMDAMAVVPSEPRVLHFSLKEGALHLNAVTFGTLEEHDVILISPFPGAEVESTFPIRGAARGPRYFEASFPIELRTAGGDVLTKAVAQAQGEWMTEELVPFMTTMVAPNTAHGLHTLVIKKDNPSGLPENDKSIEIPVLLQ